MIKKISILLIGLLAAFGTMQAQSIFSNQMTIEDTELSGGNYIKAADLDGDGDKDIIVTADNYYGDHLLGWYENLGNEVFGNINILRNVISEDGESKKVDVGDVDNDGDVDIVYSYRDIGYFNIYYVLYRNDGNAVFTKVNILTSNSSYDSPFMLYLVETNPGFPHLYTDLTKYLINTSGNFGSSFHQLSNSLYAKAHVVDLDKDSHEDIIRTYDSKLVWKRAEYDNSSVGYILKTEYIIEDNLSATINSIYSSDINNDGNTDIIVAYANSDVAYYIYDGSFGFTKHELTDFSNKYFVYANDMNNDSYSDLIIIESMKLKWYPNDGSGNFDINQENTISDIYLASDAPYSGFGHVSFDDIDNDGDIDILAATLDKAILCKNDGSGNFTKQLIGQKQNRIYSYGTVDFNNDNSPEILANVNTLSGYKLAKYEYLGNDNFSSAEFIEYPEFSLFFYNSVDVNNDGLTDFYAGQSFTNGDPYKFVWVENTGDGSFETIHDINLPEGYSMLSNNLYDIDGDGDADVISRDDNDYVWFENINGTENLSDPHTLFSQSIATGALMYSDVNKDNFVDIITYSQSSVKILLNDGNQIFSLYSSTIFGSSYNVNPLKISDLNNDNYPDLLFCDDNRFSWFENDRTGNFTENVLVENTGNDRMKGKDVFPADFDGDGDMDILAGRDDIDWYSYYSDNEIFWFENLGNGNFSSEKTITIDAEGDKQLLAADFDNDGDIDISYLSSYEDKLCWHKNTSKIQNHPLDFEICGESNAQFVITANNATSYQWQKNEGTGFTDITDDATYSGAQNNTLTIQNVDLTFAGVLFRCIVAVSGSNIASNEAEIIFDTELPQIVCLDNQTVTAAESGFYTVQGTEFDPIETIDNCEVASVENDFNNSETLENAQLPEGTTTIVWTITDVAGNENTCSFDVTVNAFVGIETLQQKGISIYPNPTNGIVNFDFTDNSTQKLSISDITGKQVIEKTEIKQNEQIDLSGFESGIYIISIQTDNEIFTTKIIKE